MHPIRTSLRALCCGLLVLSNLAAAQVPGVTREAMWYAPTEEDWAKPCLVTWQRSFQDAVTVSLATQKPILICVNMDGEIASEHYAGIRYRQPDIAALYEPYVCVIASVYRHTPRDHDAQGNRIPCPRFGGVTCGEHIAIEPGLFDEYFEDERVAPRHIMIELDRSEVYDVYYAFDTQSVFDAIRTGIEERAIQAPPDVRSDIPLADRVASRDIRDRVAVESAYRDGDRDLRRKLLESAIAQPGAAQVDMIRLAVFGFDTELARLARRALAAATDEGALDLILEALRVPMDGEEREALLAALDRIGETSDRARTLAAVHRGLEGRASTLDVDGWAQALEHSSPVGRQTLTSRLEYQAETASSRPEDPIARMQVAESFLALAVAPDVDPGFAALLLEDARQAALEAEALGATGWGVDATLALVAMSAGDMEEAHARAASAMQDLPEQASGSDTFTVALLFAQGRQQAIVDAVREKQDWPSEWLSDTHAAYSVLAEHPLSTDMQFVDHHDFLRWMGAFGKANAALDAGLARYPDSWQLHDRLRGRILRQRGIRGLEAAYEAMLQRENASPSLPWFAGYASLVAAEFYRREARQDDALAAYERAMSHYERGIGTNPGSRESAHHYVALAHAGRARVLYTAQRDEEALEELLRSFARREASAASLDGLNVNAVGTARLLLLRLRRDEHGALADRLQAALEALDPALLELPAFERGGRTPGPGRRGGGGG